MMKKALILFTLGVVSSLAADDDKIGFVFEAVRHGARAPLIDEPPGYFQVGQGLLTATGMRQRFLLGTHNRDRYVKLYDLLDEELNPGQIFVHSTNVFRVMESSYSELMGFYPPTSTSKLSENEKNSLSSGKGLPPIKIRNTTQLQNNLGLYIDGYNLIPVFNHLTTTMYDDIHYDGCHYTQKCWSYYTKDPKRFDVDAKWMFPILKTKLGKAYGFSDDQISSMNWIKFQSLCDTITAENFEGNPRRANFSAMEWFIVRNTQKVLLSKGFNEKALQIYMTRFFREPLKAIRNKVTDLLAGNETRDSLRYMMYSAHDTQLVNILEFIKPYKYQPTDQPYASTAFFELHYNTTCLTSTKDTSCFTVEMYANGLPIRFENCLASNKLKNNTSIMCSYDDFMAHFNSILYNGDVDSKCSDQFIPYPYDEEESNQLKNGLYDENYNSFLN